MDSNQHTNWVDLDTETQTKLLEEYGFYLDSLPPTCDLRTKQERFKAWLAERQIRYTW